MSDFLKLYNPQNASTLTPEQIAGLQSLTLEQIKQLAVAYPNRIYNKGYLLVKDTKGRVPMERQLPSLSTFENLYNLITKNNFKSYVAVGFKGQTQARTNVKPRRQEVVDLSDADLMHLPGFKLARQNGGEEVIPEETVPVVKVKRVPKEETVETVEKKTRKKSK